MSEKPNVLVFTHYMLCSIVHIKCVHTLLNSKKKTQLGKMATNWTDQGTKKVHSVQG
jgi:hypothetical protein